MKLSPLLLPLLLNHNSQHRRTTWGFSSSSSKSRLSHSVLSKQQPSWIGISSLSTRLRKCETKGTCTDIDSDTITGGTNDDTNNSNGDEDHVNLTQPPPIPDTISLNNALHILAKNSNGNNDNNNDVNNKVNSNHMHQSTAQKAQDLLFECERWYTNHVQNGYTILQPLQYQELTKNNENGNGSNDEQDKSKYIVGPTPDAYSYSSVIDAWAKIGNYERAIHLLRYMYELDMLDATSTYTNIIHSSRSVKPNTITYNSVINALCNSIQQGRISSTTVIESTPILAQSLLDEMKNHILQQTNVFCVPDTTTYNTVLKVWSNSLRKDCGYNSEELLNEMWSYHNEYQKHLKNQQAFINTNNTTSRLLLDVTPDQFSYSTTISAWARSSIHNNDTSAKNAERLLEQMEEYRSKGFTHLAPTTYCVNAVLNAWSKIATNNKVNGAASRAETILKRMEQLYNDGERDELRPNTISYNTVISAYARSGEVGSERRAERILRRMDRLSQERDEEENGDQQQLYSSSCKPDLISYNTVINAWSRSKNPDGPNRAEAILSHMEKQYQNGLSLIQPDVVSYTSCIAAWARRKTDITPDMPHRAQQILDKMDEAYKGGNLSAKPTVLSYNTVCNAWAKSRDKDAARQVLAILNQMETMHTSGEMYVKPDIFTYTTCIDALAKEGTKETTEKALQLLNTIEKRYNETLDTDIKPNVRTYTSVINAISRSKLGPERAEALLNHMEDMGKGGYDKDLNVDVVCFNAVLNAWGWSSEPGKARRANEIFQKMLRLFKTGENIDAKPDLITLNSLLNACAFSNVHDKEESSEAVDIAIKAFEMFQSESPVYGIPNHLTYGSMLMIFNKLLPQSILRDDLMKNVFYQCCEKGHLSGFVVSQLQHGFSNDELKALFGKAAIHDGSNVVIDKRKVPKDWSRFAGGRSRPSKKGRSIDVTKQQISRSPIN